MLENKDLEKEDLKNRALQDNDQELRYTISGYRGNSELINYLKALGFLIGIEITLKRRLPFSGPFIIELESAQFALRQVEFEALELGPCLKQNN